MTRKPLLIRDPGDISTGRCASKFPLRFPDGLRDEIKAAAKANGRSGVANLATPPTAGRGADQKNGRQPEGAARSKLTMLHKPNVPDQQGVRDFLTEGVTSLSPIEMNRVIQNCGYEHQRAVSERHVAVLADLMKRGRWQSKSQLDFAVLDGRYILINGYHRAGAQIKSGKTITWSIALHHVKTEADLRSLYYAFDTNIRTRNSRDILKAAEFGAVTGVTGEMADALFRAVPYLASKFIIDAKHKNFLVANQIDRRLELASEYAKAAQRFAAAIDGMPGGRRMKFRSGGVVAVAVATFRYQSETAWEFWSGVAHNDGLKRGDPRLALCNDFMSRKVSNASRYEVIAPAIVAWNAWFDERPLQLIKVLDGFIPVISGTPFDGKPVNMLKQAA